MVAFHVSNSQVGRQRAGSHCSSFIKERAVLKAMSNTLSGFEKANKLTRQSILSHLPMPSAMPDYEFSGGLVNANIFEIVGNGFLSSNVHHNAIINICGT
jgi:hypothetical protein